MLNSYVDLLNNGSNADCFCMIDNFDDEDEVAAEADRNNYKAGKAGDEKAAEAFVRSHAVVITDLNGNVEFDLLNQLAYSLPSLTATAVKEDIKTKNMKRMINKYFINYFKVVNGNMTEERFNRKISEWIHEEYESVYGYDDEE